VAALRRAHDRVLLIAPGSSGAALVGPGPTEVDELWPWERSEVAALFAGEAPSGPLGAWLRGVDLAVVYSRSGELARSLRLVAPRVLVHDPAPPGGVHASPWLTQPLAAIGLTAPGELEPIRPTAAEAVGARELLAQLPQGFLAIHPGSGSPRKSWPPDRFAALVEASSPDRSWLLVEGPADAEAAAPLARRPGAVRARGLDARALGAVLSCAGLFVGHDSGVSHLAASWGAPTLALFGPTDPAVWAPVGPRVRVVRAPEGRIETLSVEAVLSAARARV
jgi:glycosyl transferase family 9 (putative heptosyltransferase)